MTRHHHVHEAIFSQCTCFPTDHVGRDLLKSSIRLYDNVKRYLCLSSFYLSTLWHAGFSIQPLLISFVLSVSTGRWATVGRRKIFERAPSKGQTQGSHPRRTFARASSLRTATYLATIGIVVVESRLFLRFPGSGQLYPS